MFDIKTTLFICCFVFFAGLVDSIAGGGGLISLPAYYLAGLPEVSALGTNKFSSTFGTLVSTIRFWKNKKIHLLSAGVSVVFALIGSSLGANVVLTINPIYLKIMLVLVVPIVATFVLMKKNFGKENRSDELSPKKIVVLSAVIGLFIAFYDGFFGPGTGTFLIFLYSILLRFDLVTASGNAKICNLASNIGALATFMVSGKVLYVYAIPAAVFGILGNYIGSQLALTKGAKIIRPMFIVVLGILIATLVREILMK